MTFRINANSAKNAMYFGVHSADRNVWSLCAALDYKPISQLLLTAEVKGSLYTNFTGKMDMIANALPPIEARLSARYTHRKFTLGVSAQLYGTTKWTFEQNRQLFDAEEKKDEAPAQLAE